MIPGSFNAQAMVDKYCRIPVESIAYHKSLSDNHVNDYNLWYSKANLFHDSKLYGTAAGSAQNGLDSTKHLISDINGVQNQAFSILRMVSEVSKVSMASNEINMRYAADNLDAKSPGAGNQMRQASKQIKQKMEQIAEMEELANKTIGELYNVERSLTNMLGENTMLFNKLREAAESNQVYSQSYMDNRDVKVEPAKQVSRADLLTATKTNKTDKDKDEEKKHGKSEKHEGEKGKKSSGSKSASISSQGQQKIKNPFSAQSVNQPHSIARPSAGDGATSIKRVFVA
jgi:hypothetical protein